MESRVGRGAGERWPAPRAPPPRAKSAPRAPRPRAKSAPRAPRPQAPRASPVRHDPRLTHLTYFAQGWIEDRAGILENRASAPRAARVQYRVPAGAYTRAAPVPARNAAHVLVT